MRRRRTGRARSAAVLLLLFAAIAQQAASGGPLVAWDAVVNGALAGLRSPGWVRFFAWVTELGGPAAAAAALPATALLWRLRRRCVILPLWLAPVGALASVQLIKLLVGRPRPAPLDGVTAFGSSFPSGHAALAAAFYGILAVILVRDLAGRGGRLAVIAGALVLIGLVGFSRLLLSVHYLSDVLAGLLLGALWVLLGAALADVRCRDRRHENDGKSDGAKITG